MTLIQPIADFARGAAATRGHAETGRAEIGPLRISMVCARFFPLTGGIETHVYETSRRLSARGATVGVLTTDTTGQLPKREQLEGVSIVRVPAWPRSSDVRFAPGVFKEIARGGWDLVHVQGYHTFVAPIAMAAAKRACLPFVVTFHSGGHSSRLRNALRFPQHLALQPFLKGASQLIGVSQYEATFFGRRMGLARDRIVVVPNGGDLPRLSPTRTRNDEQTADRLDRST